MKKQNRIIIIAALICAMLFTGCGSKQSNKQSYVVEEYEVGDYYAGYDMDIMMDYAAEESSAYSKAAPYAANADNTVQKRMIQKSASLTIQVMDPIDAGEKLTRRTEEIGGFVVNYSTGQDSYSGNIKLPRANLTLRVPSEALDDTLAYIESLTGDASKDVSNKKVYGVDITSDYVDANSRLTSLEKTRDKLYEIMDTAENAEETLEVYREIADIESDIEVYKGQIKYMEESVALSSVDVEIKSIRPDPIQTVHTWSIGEVFSGAFETLFDGIKSVIEIIIYFIIVVIPILILIAIPIVLIIWLIRKYIKSKKSKKVESGIEDKQDELEKIKKE